MTASVFQSLPSFTVNRRIVSTLLIGIIIALATLFIVPASEGLFRSADGKHLFGGPRNPDGHGPSLPPRPPLHKGKGPAPHEFTKPHYEPIAPLEPTFVDQNRRGRFDTVDVWRGDGVIPDSDIPDIRNSAFRPFQPPVSSYASPGEYLKQTLVADYPGPQTEKIFFMLKTGATVMWERLPLHLATTLTRVKNFALYSDLASSIGGYEVIDILKDMPQHILDDPQLEMYRTLRDIHEQGLGGEISSLKIDNKGWDVDKFKNVPMLAHAYETSPDSEWFIFMDDDTYMFWNNIEIALSKMDHREPLYFGSAAYMGLEIDGVSVPNFAHGGSGVIISKGAMDKAFGPDARLPKKELIEFYSNITLGMCCGDMMVGYLMYKEAGIQINLGDPRWPWQRMQGEPAYAMRFHKDLWCEPVLSFHHVTAHEVEYLWEYERLKFTGNYVTYADIYHDTVQPYIVEERPYWRQWEFDRDGHHLFTPEDKVTDGDDVFVPVESAANCKKACQHDKDCMSWYHEQGVCGLHKWMFRRGLGCTPLHHSWPGSIPTSGWMIDRIRAWRGDATCDGLKDDDKFSEGWYVRAKHAEKQSSPSDAPPSHASTDDNTSSDDSAVPDAHDKHSGNKPLGTDGADPEASALSTPDEPLSTPAVVNTPTAHPEVPDAATNSS